MINFYSIFTLFMGCFLLVRKNNKSAGYFLLFLLLFLSAFRGDHVGNDTMNYMDEYHIQYRAGLLNDIANFKFDDFGYQIELLNLSMLKIVYDFGLSPRWVIYFYSIFTFLFLHLAIKRFKVNLTYTLIFYVFLGLYFFSLTAARQMCAVSVLLYAYSFLQDESSGRNKFMLWVIIASLIHSFSIIGLIAYPFSIFAYNKNYALPVFLLSCFLVTFRIDFINQLSLLMSSDHISGYVDTYGGGSGLNIIGTSFKLCLIFFLFFVWKQIDWTSDKRLEKYSNLFLFSMLFYASLVNYDGLIGRINYNLTIIFCPCIAIFLMQRNIKKLLPILFIALLYFMKGNSSNVISLTSDYYLMF